MAPADLDVDPAASAACPCPDAAAFSRWVDAALAAAGGSGEVSIRLVGEAEGRALNARYRGRDRATNVLSFPAGDLPTLEGLPPLLGDLALCAPVVAAEAVAQGKPAEAHWAHLTVHGTLHLLGHDHQDEAEALRMEALESRVLDGLGYPDPWAAEHVSG